MAYSIFGSSSTVSSGSTGLNLTKPPGLANGDFVIAAVCGLNFTPTAPAAFTLALGTNLMAVYYRLVDGSEAASWDWTTGSTQNWVGVICGVRGIDRQRNISQAAQQPGSGDTISFTGISSPPGGIVFAAAGNNSSPSSFSWPPAGYTSVLTQTNGGDAACALAYKADNASGTVTPGNVTGAGLGASWRSVTSSFYKSVNRQGVT